uniref:Uncharacterized protein n=1 Tax=Molossus molossus TaxID=27622 RepID=A0A7J8FZK6_MOLMO|nr:hypothetical protein HJG59_008292 [Molossus molossus]
MTPSPVPPHAELPPWRCRAALGQGWHTRGGGHAAAAVPLLPAVCGRCGTGLAARGRTAGCPLHVASHHLRSRCQQNRAWGRAPCGAQGHPSSLCSRPPSFEALSSSNCDRMPALTGRLRLRRRLEEGSNGGTGSSFLGH